MRRQRRAFMIVDSIVGLAILAVLGGVIAVELSLHARAAQRLANVREASQLAESALFDMQQGHALPSPQKPDQLSVQPLDDPSQTPHFAWVRVTAMHDGQSAALVGLVPADALGGK